MFLVEVILKLFWHRPIFNKKTSFLHTIFYVFTYFKNDILTHSLFILMLLKKKNLQKKL